MSKSFKLLIFCLTLTLSVVQAQAFPGASAGDGQPKATAPQGIQMASLQGTVVETVDVGSYTYVCVEKDGQKSWAAGPKTAVKIGDKVAVKSGMVMRNFASKSLGKTFDAIVFSQKITRL